MKSPSPSPAAADRLSFDQAQQVHAMIDAALASERGIISRTSEATRSVVKWIGGTALAVVIASSVFSEVVNYFRTLNPEIDKKLEVLVGTKIDEAKRTLDTTVRAAAPSKEALGTPLPRFAFQFGKPNLYPGGRAGRGTVPNRKCSLGAGCIPSCVATFPCWIEKFPCLGA